MLKDIEPRLQSIKEVDERIQAVNTYIEKMFPAWADLYDATKGQVPTLLPPLALSASEQFLNQRDLLAYDIRPSRKNADYIEPELVYIPAGTFLMGSSDSDKSATGYEKPRHRLYLPSYWIGRFPVTNEEYRYFLLANPEHKKPRNWDGNSFPKGKKRYPVRYVRWEDAVAYCRWLSQVSEKKYTLPSEAEWEKAARGPHGRIYPWGNVFDKTRCNTSESEIHGTTPVGKYSPRGDSPYGCVDMSGNVWEWTRSLGKDYPYNPRDGRENPSDSGSRVLRGGFYRDGASLARCAARNHYPPIHLWGYQGGFRVCVVGASPISRSGS
jgi:formylglycine-generating enzyme required for sulfatase activity